MPPTFPHSIRCAVLWILLASSAYLYGGITLYAAPFQETLSSLFRRTSESKNHISEAFLPQIQFALFCFRSPLLTESRLISFPAGTKTFQFPALPILSDSMRKSHWEIPGSRPTYGSPGHFVVSHVLHRRQSQVLHLTAFLMHPSMHGFINMKFRECSH